MKWWFLMIAMAAAGCMDTPTLPDEPSSKTATAVKQPATAVKRPETPRALVTPDQITESNAYEKAEALELELSQEQTAVAQRSLATE